MDPDLNLATQRALAKRIIRMIDDGESEAFIVAAANDLAEHVEALDQWIARGGFLPKAWKAQRGTREEFIALAGTTAAAVEFENRALSIGNEFLPEHARRVRDGDEPSPEYWAWLSEQFLSS